MFHKTSATEVLLPTNSRPGWTSGMDVLRIMRSDWLVGYLIALRTEIQKSLVRSTRLNNIIISTSALRLAFLFVCLFDLCCFLFVWLFDLFPFWAINSHPKFPQFDNMNISLCIRDKPMISLMWQCSSSLREWEIVIQRTSPTQD